MAQPCAGQQQGTPHHTGSTADLTVQPFNHFVDADAQCSLAKSQQVSASLMPSCAFLASSDNRVKDPAAHRASAMSSTRRTDTPAVYISARYAVTSF